MSSSIPNAIDQFIAIATAALPTTALVWFGVPMSKYDTSPVLQILGAKSTQEPAELGPNYKREEKYNINCLLVAWAGDGNHLARKSECFGFFADITIAVANNPTLNGAVRYAAPTAADYVPDADAKRWTIGKLTFTLGCTARIPSLT